MNRHKGFAKIEIMPTAYPTLKTPLLQELKMEQETTTHKQEQLEWEVILKRAQETLTPEQEQPVTEVGQVIRVHPEAAQTTQGQVQADQVLAEADDKNKINLFSLFFNLHLIFKTNLFYFNYL